MTALIAAIGVKALAYAGLGIAGLIAILFGAHTIKSSGAAEQRATDVQRGRDQDAAAIKARSGVDGLDDAAVDDKLRGFQRK